LKFTEANTIEQMNFDWIIREQRAGPMGVHEPAPLLLAGRDPVIQILSLHIGIRFLPEYSQEADRCDGRVMTPVVLIHLNPDIVKNMDMVDIGVYTLEKGAQISFLYGPINPGSPSQIPFVLV
jgi:hypothetical protein